MINSRNENLSNTVYGEVLRNLELSKASLLQETPTIQVVDQPDYPLKDNKIKWYKGGFYGMLVFFFGSMGVLLFLFDPKKNQFCGVTRFTKLQDETNFGFESGVMYEDASPNIYTDAMFMILRMGFEYLERPISGPWTVDVENERMIKLHKLVNIGKVSEITDKYYILYAKQEDYKKNIGNFLNMKFGALGGLL